MSCGENMCVYCISLPTREQADKAISSIKPAHIQEVKKLPNPADVIKMVFDCILLLFHLPVSNALPGLNMHVRRS